MPLSSFIAHRVQRHDPSKTTSLSLREVCWQQNGRIEECFRELKHCVIKRFSKDYGRFSEDIGSYPLSGWLKNYREEQLSFERFSQKAMEHLKIELDKTDVVIDGFLFFAYEKLESDELLHLFFVQHSTGQFIDGQLDISESFYLDTSNVCLAAKVNLTDWEGDDAHRSANALTLLRWRGEKELTEVFVNLLGFAEKVDVSAETEVFLDVVSEYTKDLPEEVAHSTKKQVVDYCLEQDKVGKPIVMKELSTELQNNPIRPVEAADGTVAPMPELPPFAQFIAETKPSAKPELIPDKSQLRQFVRISGRDNNLSMSFASSCLGDTIVYDPQSESITINNIPAGLKSRLAKYLQSGK